VKKSRTINIRLPQGGAIYGILLFILFFSIVTRNYLTASNWSNILRQSAVLSIITICSFLAMLTHQVDLSVGGVAGLAGMVAAVLLERDVSVAVAVVCGIAVGGLAGLINGIMAGLTTIPPFIITLAMMSISQSAGMVLRTATVQINSTAFQWFSGGHIGVIPFPAVLVLVLYIIFWYILRFRPYGTYLYAIGGKEEAALTAGINVRLVKVSVFLINGVISGIAGIMLASRVSSANPSNGMGLELDGICAAVLGGTALTGGRGSIFGALLGAIAMSLLRNGMNMMGLRLVTQKLVIGIVLLIILALDVLRRRDKRLK
jgi:ribose/xylose/arabinose/galactoside ABC-type transport system permease subunit